MKRQITYFIRTVPAVFAALFLFTASAAALSPQGEIRLTGEVLTLGHVFEGITKDAGHVLAPAPEPGKTLVLSAQDLMRIARAFNLDWQPEGAHIRSVVRRDVTLVSPERLATHIEDALSQRLNGAVFEVELDRRAAALYLPHGATPEITVARLDFDPSSGRMTAGIVLEGGGARKKTAVTGRAHRLVDVPVLNRRLRNGDVIGAQDIDLMRMRLSQIPSSAVLDTAGLVGQTPRRVIDAMQPVIPENIAAPLAVRRGEHVTLHLQHGHLTLTARGRSLENGAEGEIIRVMNTSSNRVIEGVVVGAQSVRVNTAEM